eukprot:11206728-Lingulodinium_polyedra.AAC.1
MQNTFSHTCLLTGTYICTGTCTRTNTSATTGTCTKPPSITISAPTLEPALGWHLALVRNTRAGTISGGETCKIGGTRTCTGARAGTRTCAQIRTNTHANACPDA